jgi:hypothetical protein
VEVPFHWKITQQNKIKLCDITPRDCKVESVLWKSLLPQTLRKISAKKYLSQYIIYNVKDINTAVDCCMCDYCYCSGLHDLHMYVSHLCSGCVMQCGMLLVATVFQLHNKPLLCQVNCTVY